MSESVWLSNLIEKTLKNSNLRARLSRVAFTDTIPFAKPFITIAREPGSGGAPIGTALAARLGFDYYDQQIIDEISKSTKLRKDIVQKLDEKGRTAVQDFIQGMLNPNYVSDVKFVRTMTTVLVSLAYGGNAVILGRGANFVTPRDKGLHVRITAPRSIRVQRAIEYEGVSATKAREIIRDVESDRRNFVRQYFSEDIRKSEHYDLVINSAFFSVDDCVDIILHAFSKKFPQAKVF